MNPYEVLGVPSSATAEEIRTAYRRLTLAYHPDRNSSPGASDWMAQINRAYAVLSDPAQRAAYDRQQRAAGGRVRCTACTNGEVIRGHDGQKIRCPICLGRGTISREQARREQARQEEAQRRPRHNWQQLRDEGRNTAKCARCGLIRTQNRARSGSSSAAPWDYYIEGRGGQWERAAYGLDRDCIPQPRPAPQTPPPSRPASERPAQPRPTPTAEPAAAAPTPPTSAPARRKSRGWLAVTAFSLIVLLLGALAFGLITNWGENLALDSPNQDEAAPSSAGVSPSGLSQSAPSPANESVNGGDRVASATLETLPALPAGAVPTLAPTRAWWTFPPDFALNPGSWSVNFDLPFSDPQTGQHNSVFAKVVPAPDGWWWQFIVWCGLSYEPDLPHTDINEDGKLDVYQPVSSFTRFEQDLYTVDLNADGLPDGEVSGTGGIFGVGYLLVGGDFNEYHKHKMVCDAAE